MVLKISVTRLSSPDSARARAFGGHSNFICGWVEVLFVISFAWLMWVSYMCAFEIDVVRMPGWTFSFWAMK